MLTQNLGYPRIGVGRELKKACENYWAGRCSTEELLEAGKNEKIKNWALQQECGIDLIPCNDFSFYDQVMDHSVMFGVIPERFRSLEAMLSETDLYFAMCRGYQKDGFDIIAMEMTKWFDTNYHYLVPEFAKNQKFELRNSRVSDEFNEAVQAGIKNPKPVLIGPVSYLLLGKEKEEGFHRLDLIDQLLALYIAVLKDLQTQGCLHVQIDEPFLVTILDEEVKGIYQKTYERLSKELSSLKIILATYFGDLGDNISLACNLPVDTLHIDLVRGQKQFKEVLNNCHAALKLSLGVVEGRNVWKNDYSISLDMINEAATVLGHDKLFIAPSCSLLHSPYDLDLEDDNSGLPGEIKNWLSFAKQKLKETHALKVLFEQGNWSDSDLYIANQRMIEGRRNSLIVHNEEVKKKVAEAHKVAFERKSPFPERISLQEKKLNLPFFPTTTIGSFPQTDEVRKKRLDFRKGNCSQSEYDVFLKQQIRETIEWQEEIDMDVLVHGEYERNDMVEYFGEKFDGIVFTRYGWVQSYGSRGVKPPIIFGDVSRKEPVTVRWSEYAQSLTDKKVKGMLTGPVTILQWSFVRDDQPRKDTTFQIALALRQEVKDLEKAGIGIIQIDEPALREGLPLKKSDWKHYLDWAVKAFRICSATVNDETQIHTHMCYAEFNDIMEAIAAMDADVISIETSRSQMELLKAFDEFKYPNQIGPGVYDIHSPRTPSVGEMTDLIEKAMEFIPAMKLWVNPDCGLKTRKWDEVKPALANMIEAAKEVRKTHSYLFAVADRK